MKKIEKENDEQTQAVLFSRGTAPSLLGIHMKSGNEVFSTIMSRKLRR